MNAGPAAAPTPERLVLRAPDDFHVHLRDGAGMRDVVQATARVFPRALVMPNLSPPVATVALAEAYRARILAALPPGLAFTPLMTLYLTDVTRAEEIAAAKRSGFIPAVKYYPAGATTNSASGVTRIEHAWPALAAMEAHGVVLSVHGEVTTPEVDIFDRERVFVDAVLARIVREFPSLRVVLEHITTQEGAEFVAAAGPNIAATITPQHLLFSRNDLLVGGIRPHLYCLPVLKRERHRQALIRAATSGSPKFFLGTDSAPHAVHTKETACGCAGCYSAPAAIELYAAVFEAAGALHRLDAFASRFGAAFYGLPPNEGTILLTRKRWSVPATAAFGESTVIPLCAGSALEWQVTPEFIEVGR